MILVVLFALKIYLLSLEAQDIRAELRDLLSSGNDGRGIAPPAAVTPTPARKYRAVRRKEYGSVCN